MGRKLKSLDPNEMPFGLTKTELKNFLKNEAKKKTDESRFHLRSCLYLLNTEQQKVLHEMCKYMNSTSQLLCLVGPAGVGKNTVLSSFVLKVIEAKKKYKTAGSTGLCSIGVKSCTIYSLLSIFNVKADPQSQINSPVSKGTYTSLKDVSFICIDEANLFGLRMLYIIDKRLQVIRKNNKPFGNCNLVLILDKLQETCIADTSLYKPMSEICESDTILREAKQLFLKGVPFNLFEQNRCKNDKILSGILERMRLKSITHDDIANLNSRLIENVSEEERLRFNDALRIFPFNLQVEKYNFDWVKDSGINAILIEPIMIPFTCLECKKEYRSFLLAKGLRVILLKNLFVKLNLVNGSVLRIVDIKFSGNRCRPEYLLCRTDETSNVKYSGNHLPNTDVFPIHQKTEYIWCNHKQRRLIVKSFNLMNYQALSILKTQGMTLPMVVTDLSGLRRFSPTVYVSLSRCRNLSDMLLKCDVPLQRILPCI